MENIIDENNRKRNFTPILLFAQTQGKNGIFD
jgi:hypothetical protein